MLWCSTGVVLEWSFSGGVFLCGGLFVVVWCSTGSSTGVVFLWWCFSGGVFVVMFLWWCFCGGVV